jgi:hypothetical protein
MAEKVVDDPSLRTVYSYRLIGVSVDSANITVTLAGARRVPDRTGEAPETKLTAFINNRIALLLNALVDLHRATGEAIASLKVQVEPKSAAPATDKKVEPKPLAN